MAVQFTNEQNFESNGAAQPQGSSMTTDINVGHIAGNSVGKANVSLTTNTLGLIDGSRGNKDINALVEGMVQSMKDNNLASTLKILVLDKEKPQFSNLNYSCIVISLASSDYNNAATGAKVTDNAVCYFPILVESTGRAPLSAAQIMQELNQSGYQKRPEIHTVEDAMNDILHNIIVAELDAAYKTKFSNYINVDGCAIPAIADGIANNTNELIVQAYNALVTNIGLTSGISDFNISVELDAERKSGRPRVLEIRQNYSRDHKLNSIGLPVRADFQLTLNSIDESKRSYDLNQGFDESKEITSVCGFVDAIPTVTNVPVVNSLATMQGIRFVPHIIVTDTRLTTPTPGLTLLSAIVSSVMANKSFLYAALAPHKGAKDHVGNLNVIANTECNQDGRGAKMDLTNAKYDTNTVNKAIKGLFPLDPILSIDVPVCGPQSHYMSVFSVAAQPLDNAARRAARKTIIRAAGDLTNGHFDPNFPEDQIFVNEGISVPMGVWSAKSGYRDIRDVDLAFIASRSDDVELIGKWVTSNFPSHRTGADPYLSKVDVLNKLGLDCVITQKAVRVTLSPLFVNALTAAASSAGLDVRYEQDTRFLENDSFTRMTQFYTGSGLSGNLSFAHDRSANAAGYAYNTGYHSNAWRF